MIAIVGATGYIGRYLCPNLVKKGYDVLALGRSKNAQIFFEQHKVPFMYFDLNDEQYFKELDKYSITAIVDLSACLAEHETPVEDFFRVNTLGVYKLLDYCVSHNIKRFVMTSSHKVYNDVNIHRPISETDSISFKGDHSPYIISKLAAENFVTYYHKDFGISGIVLRLTGVHGYGEILGFLEKDGTYHKSSFELFFEKALAGEPIEVWGNQMIKRDHIYIKDVLNAIECALNVSNSVSGIYNIASGIAYSQMEEAQVLAKVFATENGISIVTNYPEKTGLIRGYCYNIEKAKKELKWEPQFSDLETLYNDYKKEWITKEYHNYHHIKKGQEPKTL